eukprot:5524219-Prymnesium_polylepis.1
MHGARSRSHEGTGAHWWGGTAPRAGASARRVCLCARASCRHTYMQMRESELLSKDTTGKDLAVLERLRAGARDIAQGSLDATTWGDNKNRVFAWLESIMQD